VNVDEEFELILYLQRLVSRHLRTIAMVATVAILASLFIGGRQPVAVNLVSHPWDKLLHAGVFALLACTIGLASDLRGRQKLAVAFFGALLVGALDEWHQMYLPGREAGWSDFIADIIGSIFGTIFLAIFLPMKGTRSLPIS
jgi:VanZ family protein